MDSDSRVSEWIAGLTDEQLAEARANQGNLPEWLATSMTDAGIAVARYDSTAADGTPAHGTLILTSVRDALERTLSGGR